MFQQSRLPAFGIPLQIGASYFVQAAMNNDSLGFQFTHANSSLHWWLKNNVLGVQARSRPPPPGSYVPARSQE